MAATLLQLCTDALDGVDGFETPSTIVGNTAQTGRELAREVKWQTLKTAYTFATVASTSAYSLPADFQRFANLTFWNTSEDQPLIGPLNGIDWAALTRGLPGLGIRSA